MKTPANRNCTFAKESNRDLSKLLASELVLREPKHGFLNPGHPIPTFWLLVKRTKELARRKKHWVYWSRWEQLTYDHDVELKALLHGLPSHLLQDGVDAHIAEVQHRLAGPLPIVTARGVRQRGLRHGGGDGCAAAVAAAVVVVVAGKHLWSCTGGKGKGDAGIRAEDVL